MRLRVASAEETTTPSSQVSEEADLPNTLRSHSISEKVKSGMAADGCDTQQHQNFS